MNPDRRPISGSPTERARFLARLDTVARLALSAGGVIALLMVLRSVNLEWSGQRRFATAASMLWYYALPAGVAVILLGALRLRPRYRARLLLTCIAIGFSVYAIELILLASSSFDPPVPAMTRLGRAKDRKTYAAKLSRTSGQSIDFRTIDELLLDIRKTDASAIPIVTPSNHLFLTQPDGRVTSSITID